MRAWPNDLHVWPLRSARRRLEELLDTRVSPRQNSGFLRMQRPRVRTYGLVMPGRTIWCLLACIAPTCGAAEIKQVLSQSFRPEQRAFTEDKLQQLKVPPQFRVNIFARDLGNARMMLLAPDGTIFLTRHKEGDLVALRDRNGDGRADDQSAVLKLKEVHGIALRDNVMYLATTKKLLKARLDSQGRPEQPQEFADLPDGGQHPRRTLGFDSAGLLYVSIGSTCNNCEESNPEHATMVRMRPDGSQRRVFARGLRNTIGFAWHPQTAELWGMDHGSDDRGNDVPLEELNLLKDGADYGWPFCHGSNQVDEIATKPRQGTKEEHCAKATPPTLAYQAHSAPIAFLFYTGELFPAEFRHDAFVALHGSWNRSPAVGYKVVRVKFENGRPVRIEDFLSGFLIEEGKAHFGRPAGLAVARDGALLISDDAGGVIYRVAYGG